MLANLWIGSQIPLTALERIPDAPIASPMNIIDPVTIVQFNEKSYLITTESQLSWFRDQNYTINLWEID